MKKVVNINLGGKKFTIDDDAYIELENYLNSIKYSFANSTGFEDIIYDIESRLAELFEENNNGSEIVSIEKVRNVMGIMGKPSDFNSEEPENVRHTHTHYSKRLFRDPENKALAGVASGLTAYYGMKSPLIFRGLFLLLAFSGIGILPYLLLWLFVPIAKTSSDKLSMHGEKINIETIAKSVEESLTDIKDTLEDIGKKVKENF